MPYSWHLQNSEADGANPTNYLVADTSAAEVSSYPLDFLSNGFKPRHSLGGFNGSGAPYIYLAFAESPFVNSNGVPTNAR